MGAYHQMSWTCLRLICLNVAQFNPPLLRRNNYHSTISQWSERPQIPQGTSYQDREGIEVPQPLLCHHICCPVQQWAHIFPCLTFAADVHITIPVPCQSQL